MENKTILNTPVPRNFFPKKVTKEHYKFGSSPLPKEIIMPDGHGWKDYRPDGETQSKNGIDPETCPMGGTQNALEGIGNFKFNKGLRGYKSFQDNLSERYGSIMMGMSGSGGWPWDAAIQIRSGGCVPEVYLPFDDSIKTIKQYFSPRPMTYSLFKIGLHWSKIYDFGFEWVYEPGDNLSIDEKNARMMEALKYSRLCVAGYAWSLHSDGKYYNDGSPIHWFDVDDFSQGNYWDAFDTYPPFGKRLDWNYNPAYCMRYSLTKRLGADEDTEFHPEDASGVKVQYLIYLAKWFVNSLINK